MKKLSIVFRCMSLVVCNSLLMGMSFLMGMSPAVNMLKVPASHLPFNPFVPRVAWIAEKCLQKNNIAVEAVLPVVTQLKKSLLANASRALAFSTLARRPMTAQAYVPKIKVLESALMTPCEDVGVSKKITLSSFVTCFTKKQTIKSIIKPMAAIKKETYRHKPIAEKMIDCEASFSDTNTRKTLVGGPLRAISLRKEPIEKSIPAYEQRLLRRFDFLAQQAVERMQQDTSVAVRLLGIYDRLARQHASDNNVVQWLNMSQDHQNLLIETGVIPVIKSTKKSKRITWWDQQQTVQDVPQQNKTLSQQNVVQWDTLSPDHQDLLVEAGVMSRQNVVQWQELSPNHQDLLVETGAISTVENTTAPEQSLSWWGRVKNVLSAGSSVLRQLDKEHPGMC